MQNALDKIQDFRYFEIRLSARYTGLKTGKIKQKSEHLCNLGYLFIYNVPGTGMGCPERWWSHQSWKYSRIIEVSTKGHGLMGTY